MFGKVLNKPLASRVRSKLSKIKTISQEGATILI